jgi:transcriptional regulator with XRE-family HTH domain
MTPLAQLEHFAEHGDGTHLPNGKTAHVLRVDAGLTPTECAAVVGVSERTWTRFERGITNGFMSAPTERRAARLLAFLASASKDAVEVRNA